MDANLIYEKTTAGEEAVRQRTRVVQRNTRMVLILVDGKSTVGELCEKAGNAQMVESALQDLERDGLVVPKLAPDSVWEQSKKVAEEIRNAAVAKLGKEPAAPAPRARAVPPPPSPPIQSTLAQNSQTSQISQFSQFSEGGAPEPFSIAPMSMAPHSVFSSASGTPPATPVAQVDEKPAKARRGDKRKVADDDDFSVKAIRRGPRGPYVSLPLAVALGVVGLVVVVAAVFALYPYDRHRPGMEAALSALIGQPVKIGELRANFTPKPVISAESLVVEGNSGLRVSQLRLVPEVFSLLGSRPSFSSVEISRATFSGGALAQLKQMLDGAGRSDAPFKVDAVAFSGLTVNVAGLPLTDLQGEFSLASKVPETINLVTADRSLKISLKPQAGRFVADIEGYAWRPQADSAFVFDSVQTQAVWSGESLQLTSLDVHIFDGAISGALVFSGSAGASLAGDVDIKHMNVSRLAAAMGYPGQFEGEMNGTFKFSGAAAEWPGVLAATNGAGEMTIVRGVLGGFDLVEAVRRGGRAPLRGGSTRYDQMVGKVKISPQTIRFSDLGLSAGVLRAGGVLEVARDRQVAGRLDVEMRGSANVVKMPVNVSGPLKEPTLMGGR